MNGAPARLGPNDRDPAAARHSSGDTSVCDLDVIVVELATDVTLNAGDTVSVTASSIKLGDREDQRNVAPASRTVPAAAVDRDRPLVTIQAIVTLPSFKVTVSDPFGSAVSPVADEDDDEAFDADDIVFDASGDNELGDITANDDGTYTVALDTDQMLERGDRITIKGNVFEDTEENKNRPVSQTAVLPPEHPRVVSVLMSQPVHSHNASTRVSAAIAGDAVISIAANGDDVAAGAASNDWSIVYDKASTYDKKKDVDIDVRVNSRDKIVSVRFNDGEAKYNDLVDALNEQNSFSALFTAANSTSTNTTDPCLGKQVNKALPLGALDRQVTDGLTGGVTGVAIEVRFNGFVDAILDAALFDDVFKETLKRNTAADAEALITRDDLLGSDDAGNPKADVENSTSSTFAIAEDTDLIVTGLDAADNTSPTVMARYELLTTNVMHLPKVRDLVDIVGGKDTVVADPDATPPIDDAEEMPDVAIGFIDDADTADENEKLNARSQHRILTNSGVSGPVTPSYLPAQ